MSHYTPISVERSFGRYGEIILESNLIERYLTARALYTATKKQNFVFTRQINFFNMESNCFRNLDYLNVKPSLTETAMTKNFPKKFYTA